MLINYFLLVKRVHISIKQGFLSRLCVKLMVKRSMYTP